MHPRSDNPPQSRYLVSIGAICALVVIILLVMYLFRPQANRNFTPPVTRISIDAQRLTLSDVEINIQSYGLVEARVNSKVVAQVNGRVVYVSEQFRDGAFFKEGDLLLQIEQADYEIEVEIAAANMTEATRVLEEELAASKQARQDWDRLGRGGKPAALVLREPQLKSARAMLRSANARLKQAQLNLERCEIRAPFDGRVLSSSIDLGQVVSNNTTLADIFATDAVEIRLPIKNRELSLLYLPEDKPDGESLAAEGIAPAANVEIISQLAGKEIWYGTMVRTAGSIDSSSRQLYVVVRIDDPFGRAAEGRFPLKIGQYVTARIKGRTIKQAISIPNSAIYQGSYVYVLKEGAVYRQEIEIYWQDKDIVIIEEGLGEGDLLVLTPLGKIHSGTKVTLNNAEQLGIQQENNTGSKPGWLSRIPPERLKKMQAQAKKEGISLEALAKKSRGKYSQGAAR